jgi:hypothetical protein
MVTMSAVTKKIKNKKKTKTTALKNEGGKEKEPLRASRLRGLLRVCRNADPIIHRVGYACLLADGTRLKYHKIRYGYCMNEKTQSLPGFHRVTSFFTGVLHVLTTPCSIPVSKNHV